MTMTLILAMCAFSFAMSISPGPVNMVIILSGVNYGFKKTMAFVSGATIGFTLLLLSVGFGFAQIFIIFPSLLKYLTIIGSLFIVYLGYKVATSDSRLNLPTAESHAPTFWEGFLLQWFNPKAWIAAASGVSLFSSIETNLILITFIIIYFLICYACLALWALIGYKATAVLNTKGRLRIFNWVMGLLLIFTACYLLYNQFFIH